jgi:2-polyprenyl-3-methyl-5-hydroxy-6-metoxy-1,4-benzoquinol methylase
MLVPTESVRQCPNCGGQGRSAACIARDRLYRVTDQTFRYSRCSNCGVLYQSVRPVESAIHRFYPSDYAPYQPNSTPPGHLEPEREPQKQFSVIRKGARLFARWLNRKVRWAFPDSLQNDLHAWYAPQHAGMTLLDFGCGSEAFLNQAQARGWNTIGVDFAPEVVENVRRAGHACMFVSPELWDQIADESIDCIRMNHVLEHLYSPRVTLSQLRKKLKPGGRIHIATPNSACWTFKVMGERWFSLDCPRHIAIYTPPAARKLLADLGYRHVRTVQEVLTKDMARSIGYWLVDRDRLDHEAVIGLQSHAGLADMLYTPARLASLCGVADRFHAFAYA